MRVGGSRRLDTETSWYFVGRGATAAVIPAMLPAFALPVVSLLPAVPPLFLGLLLGVVSAPGLASRIALTNVLRCGAATQVAGLTLVAVAPAPARLIVAAAVAGAGFGVVESAGTAVTRLLNDTNTPSRLIALTFLVGAVATVTPVVVLLLNSFGLIRFAPVAAGAAPATAWVMSRRAVVPPALQEHSAPKLRPEGSLSAARPVALLPAALFFYVGGESVLSGWSAVTLTEHWEPAPQLPP